MLPWRRSAAVMASLPAWSFAGEYGLTARKAPQPATAALADGAANEAPAFTTLCDLVRPPEGTTAIELKDGRRVFAPAGSSPAEVKRELAGKEKAL